MGRVGFGTWWVEFLAEPRVRGAKDGGYAAVDELNRYVTRLAHGLREEFVDELVTVACKRQDGWGLAIGALEGCCTPAGFARIAAEASKLRASSDEEAPRLVVWYLRVFLTVKCIRHVAH